MAERHPTPRFPSTPTLPTQAITTRVIAGQEGRIWAYERTGLHALARLLAYGAFTMLVTVVLSSPVFWQVLPFRWGPIDQTPLLFLRPPVLGWLTVLPGLLLVSWLMVRAAGRFRTPWSWGRPSIAIPFLGLTALMLTHLGDFPDWRPGYQIVGLGLAWLVYLFIVNERPPIVLPLALVTLIQGLVAIGQFARQRSLDLVWLGELYLDTTFYGVSVLWVNERPWLRAYGLTAHPNFLGAVLTIALLQLLLSLARSSNGRRILLLPILAIGLLGLLVSFSRASWLAFGIGLALWTLGYVRGRPRAYPADARLAASLITVTVALIGLIFFARYSELILSRFLSLNTPTEARSLAERIRDDRLALQVILRAPWRGVGVGNYLVAARKLVPNALTVHNASLLVGAELGIPGLLLWLWLALIPFYHRHELPSSAYLAPWLAMLVIGLFDTTLWPTVSWSSGVLFAILTAQLATLLDEPDTLRAQAVERGYDADRI